jgi:hypothetical protein
MTCREITDEATLRGYLDFSIHHNPYNAMNSEVSQASKGSRGKLYDKLFVENADGSVKKYRLNPNFNSITAEDATEDEIDPGVDGTEYEKHSSLPAVILSNFRQISFNGEQDEIRGLEKMVNDNFYSLFTKYTDTNSFLIADNRLFKLNMKMNDETISGISGIPDALLIHFDADSKENPFSITLIEYECYGRRKKSLQDKTVYFNTHIFPQLTRFANNFSIITDQRILGSNIDSFASSIEKHVRKANKGLVLKWMKSYCEDEFEAGAVFKELINKGIRTNLRIMLVIDEITAEQRDTLRSVIGSYKLAGHAKAQECTLGLLTYQVNLLQDTGSGEYALSVKEY